MLRYTRILILHLDPKCIVCFIGITVYYFSLTLSAFKVSKDVELRRNITKSTKANNWTRWEPKGRGCRSGRRGQRWKRSSLIFYFIIQQKFPSPQDVIKKSNYYFNKIHKTIFSCIISTRSMKPYFLVIGFLDQLITWRCSNNLKDQNGLG